MSVRTYILLAVGAMALVVPPAATPAAAATSEPIRVGAMAPLSGLFAQPGKDIIDGFRLYFEQIGFQAAGRKIELIEEDDEGNNATAVTKYRKLVERDRIHVFGGVVLVNIGYALAPMFDRDRVPALFVTSPDDLTKRRRAHWMIRAAMSASQPMHAMGDYAYKVLGYRKVASVALDNGFGHESVGGFQRVFEDLGGKVVQKLWTPLNAVDYAPYITQIQRDVDAVVVANAGAGSVRFIKQYAEYGLKGKIPLIGTGVTSEDTVLRGLNDEAEGFVGALHYASTLPGPANQAFVKAVMAKSGRTPSYFQAAAYSGARWIAEAAKRVDGNVEDRERFLQAIRQAANGEDLRGPIQIDEYGNPTHNIYILKVEKVGGKLQNTVIYTYPMVSQFWTYKPEEFLKTPAYSRDYPPVRP